MFAIVTAVIIFFIPNVFWGNLYMVGGDDARLYYLFPLEYLKNFSFNVMSGNTLGGNLGYMPVSYSAPNIAFLAILKQLLPFVNTQLITYGFIFSLGFLFLYLFFQELTLKKSSFITAGCIIASLFYITSPYITKTYFQSQFISMFLLMVVPGSLYLFVSGLKRKSSARVVAASLFYSMFGASVFGFPWLIPVVLTLLPFFVYLAVLHGKYFWKMMFVFIGVFLSCNVYWIIHYIIQLFGRTTGSGYLATLVSDSFVQQNSNLVSSLLYLNSPINQIINHVRISWSDRQGAGPEQLIGLIYLAIILIAGTMLHKTKKSIRILFLTGTGGLLLAMLFFTPNFGLWNVQLFKNLINHIPFFVIFRNMYDKFALAMAFHYAFAIWISFVIIREAGTKRIYKLIIIATILLITIARFVPYAFPKYKESDHRTHISGLNQDYMDLTRYIRNLNTTSRFVWYPMTFGDYVFISDGNNPNHYYIGVSPLQIFAGASDLAGFYGLQTPGDPELHWKVLNLLQQSKFNEVGTIFKQQNVGYVIVNHEPVPKNGSFILEQFDFMKSQNEEYKKTILGEKIRDFGKRYSLYKIHPEFYSPTVFLNNQEIMFRRNSDSTYDIGPFTITQQTRLYLMEPYSRLWRLVPKQEENTIAAGYGNEWLLYPGEYYIHAEFWPNKYIAPSLIFSITAATLAGLYCLIALIKKKM